jgi:hypothetical protein
VGTPLEYFLGPVWWEVGFPDKFEITVPSKQALIKFNKSKDREALSCFEISEKEILNLI